MNKINLIPETTESQVSSITSLDKAEINSGRETLKVVLRQAIEAKASDVFISRRGIHLKIPGSGLRCILEHDLLTPQGFQNIARSVYANWDIRPPLGFRDRLTPSAQSDHAYELANPVDGVDTREGELLGYYKDPVGRTAGYHFQLRLVKNKRRAAKGNDPKETLEDILDIRIRCLPPEPRELPSLNYADNVLEALGTFFSNKRGLLIVTGPPECGLTTAITAILKHKGQEKRVYSIDEHFDYDLGNHGVIQLKEQRASNQPANYLVSRALRMAPDVIGVARLRDKEAGHMAHLASQNCNVVGTMEEVSSLAALNRLISWVGKESVLMSPLAIINQRLVPMACVHCKQEKTVPIASLPFPVDRGLFGTRRNLKVVEANGCPHCYKGAGMAIPLTEVRAFEADHRLLVVENRESEIRSTKFDSLADNALALLERGLITLETARPYILTRHQKKAD